jgi:hypothetical protein
LAETDNPPKITNLLQITEKLYHYNFIWSASHHRQTSNSQLLWWFTGGECTA